MAPGFDPKFALDIGPGALKTNVQPPLFGELIDQRRVQIALPTGSDPNANKHAEPLFDLARPERFELPTAWFVARYSIQLSYGRILERRILVVLIDSVNLRRRTVKTPRQDARCCYVRGSPLGRGYNMIENAEDYNVLDLTKEWPKI